MKKLTAMLLTMAMAMTMLVGCGSNAAPAEDAAAAGSAAAAQGSGASAEERTQLIVGFDAEFPPYGYLDEETNEYTGLDLDLAQAVCDYYGWELKKQPIDWDAKDMELNSGSIDCIWNGFTITGREDEYTWSSPYTPEIKPLEAGSDGTVVVRWNKNSAVSGYELEYTPAGGYAVVINKKQGSAHKKLTGLARGTSYAIRVRSYLTVKGGRRYSGWSETASVTVS